MSDQKNNKQAIATSHESLFNQFRNWCDKVERKFKVIVWVLGVFAAIIVSAWYLLGPRVDAAVKKVVLSQEVLANISSRLRPYAVIDTMLNNAPTIFENDQGVGDIVDSADFRQGESNFKGVLTLRMKRYMPLAPLVKPLTADVYVHSFWRTNKYDWAYDIRSGSVTITIPGENGERAIGNIAALSKEKDYKFFVELLNK